MEFGFFVIYALIAVVAIILAASRKARFVFAAVLLGAIVFAGILSLHGVARADTAIHVTIREYNRKIEGNTVVFSYKGNYYAFEVDNPANMADVYTVFLWDKGTEDPTDDEVRTAKELMQMGYYAVCNPCVIEFVSSPEQGAANHPKAVFFQEDAINDASMASLTLIDGEL